MTMRNDSVISAHRDRDHKFGSGFGLTDGQGSIMFDDDLNNLTAATALGLRTVQSSPNCGGVYCDTGCGIMEAGVQAITDRPAAD